MRNLDNVIEEASERVWQEDPIVVGGSTHRLVKELETSGISPERSAEIAALLVGRSKMEGERIEAVGQHLKEGLAHALQTKNKELLRRVLERLQEIIHGKRESGRWDPRELESMDVGRVIEALFSEKPPQSSYDLAFIVGTGTKGERIFVDQRERVLSINGRHEIHGSEYRKNFAALFGIKINPDAPEDSNDPRSYNDYFETPF